MPIFKDPTDSNSNDTNDALVQVLTENLKQQKRSRRWKAIGRLFYLLIFVLIFYSLSDVSNPGKDFMKGDVRKPHTALIEVKGMIAEDSFYGSAEHVIDALRKAYEQPNVKGIILDLNSPGGSPVQSDLIYSEILNLQAEDKNNRKVYSVVSDVCASGCYYIAAATDQIYVNELSTVGSIGVLYGSFGVNELMKKVGVDRRLQTAGKYKAFLDPYSEESEEGKKIIQQHLNIVHDIFIRKVTDGRKGRVKTDNPDIFSGLFWTGKQAEELGLVDGFKSKRQVAKEIIGAEDIIDYTAKPALAEVLVGNFPRASMSLDNTELLKKWLLNSELANKYSLQ